MVEAHASSLCFCAAKKTVHVHCACNSCNGKPVNYRTQQSHLQLESERQTFEAARYRAGEAKGKFKSVVRKWPKQAPRMTYSYFNTHT